MDSTEQLAKDIAEIKAALLGSDFNKNGLVNRVDELEKSNLVFKKMQYLIIGGFAVVTYIMNFLK